MVIKKNGGKKKHSCYHKVCILGYIMLYFLFIPGKPWMYVLYSSFFSFGIGSLFAIMMSMTADVIDVDELNSGKKKELFWVVNWDS